MLRGLAAFLIMAKHALYEVDFNTSLPFSYGAYDAYTIGIDIFFILSGFIMVYTSWGQSGPVAARDFMLRRIIRIVPIYWFYTFVLMGVALFIPQVLAKAQFVPEDFLKSLFFIPHVNSAGEAQPFLANGWTLNYEMYFYAVFALCLLIPARYGLAVLIAYFVASLMTDFWFMADGIVQYTYSNKTIYGFVYGVVLGILFQRNVRLPSIFFYIGLAVMFAAVAALPFTDELYDMGIVYPKTYLALAIVALMILPKGAEHRKMPRLSVMAGDASYTIYLSHPFVLGAVTQIMVFLGLNNIVSPWAVFALCVATSLIGGYIAYRLIEKPMTDSLRQYQWPSFKLRKPLCAS